MAIPSFVDRVTLHVYGGNGGHGCASVHREKFKPLGGPDGGNGGHGGSVILRVDTGVTTLVDFHRQSHRRADSGVPGKGDHANGANGEDIVLAVPDGTVVSDADTGETLADLTGHDTEVVVAAGGRGGLGNAALASSSRKAPGFALLGEEGDERTVTLELKVVADVGPGRLPQRRQVLPGGRHLAGPAEDRGLPVHHAGPQPRGRGRRRHDLHRGRRARSDRGRLGGPRPRPRLPAPHRALRRDRARARLRHLRARSRPGHRPRRDRGRAGRPRRAGGPASAGRAEQDRRARRRRAGRDRPARARGPGSAGLRDLDQVRGRSAGPDVRHGRDRRPAAGHAAAAPAGADRAAARPRSAGRTSSPSGARTTCGGSRAPNPSAGCGRPTSATRRPWATWPTG